MTTYTSRRNTNLIVQEGIKELVELRRDIQSIHYNISSFNSRIRYADELLSHGSVIIHDDVPIVAMKSLTDDLEKCQDWISIVMRFNIREN